MVMLDTRPLEQTMTGSGDPRMCEGCPRCQDVNAPWCPAHHPETPGVHPICKWCHHCVLRGSHVDDAEDVRDGRFAGRNDYMN